MESRLDFVLPLLFALFLLYASSPSFTTASPRFVKTVCSKTISSSECMKALKPDHRTASASNYKEIAPIALDLALANAKDTYIFLKKLMKTGTSPSEAAIKECAEGFESVKRDYKSARGELDVDPTTANYDIAVVSDGLQRCETALKNLKSGVPGMSSRIHLAYLYRNIGFVITDNLD